MATFTPNSQDNQHTVASVPQQPTEDDVREALRTIMRYIGEDPEREGLRNTPDRIVRMYDELFRGYHADKQPRITTFTNAAHSEEMVFDSGDYYSMCEHHMLPFFGKYYFAYIPSAEGRILGISKVARVVAYCAARLQLQERLCREIIEMLADALTHTRTGKPLVPAQGFAIVMKGQHLCKSMRGIKNKGDMTVSYFTGCFKTNRQFRNEFFNMIAMQ